MKITTRTLHTMKAEGQKIAMLTCYDSSFAAMLANAGVDILLVGDSLGMVVQGHSSTLPVTLEHMIYHTRCVASRAGHALVLADLPFGSYQQSKEQAFTAAAALMQAGAEMVKLEGGAAIMAETTEFLVKRGIPVCAHVGLTPQSVHTLGGYRVQGKSDAQAQQLLDDVQALVAAGADLLLMEMVPATLAAEVTRRISVPTIGIGAGADTSGQVLVLHDMLDVYPGKKARFVKNYMQQAQSIADAVSQYVQEVKNGTFPGSEHSY